MAAHHETWKVDRVDVYAMHLHQTLPVTGILSVTRVPGGWVYRFNQPGDLGVAPVFVPWHNEFQSPLPEGITEPKA